MERLPQCPEYPDRGRKMNAAVATTPVTTHYDALLASRYTWMMGGLDGCLSAARALLDAVGLTDEGSGTVLDLGAGAGYHARVLASRGFNVIAVDTSDILLRELGEVCAGLPVTAVQADLLDESKYAQHGPFALIVCAGDTLTHLSDIKDTDRLIRMAARLLMPGGALLLQFREQPRDLSPQEGIITMRSERDRIMQCVLHFAPDRVWVTDIVHEWNGQAWLTVKSTYPKLRLSTDALLESATLAGLNIRFNETILRQRVLVLTRSDSK
jgi:SAM-dependent methyltransferase